MSTPARKGGFFAAITSSFSNFGSAAYSKVNRSVKLPKFSHHKFSHICFHELDMSVLCSLHPNTTSLRCLKLLCVLRLCPRNIEACVYTQMAIAF